MRSGSLYRATAFLAVLLATTPAHAQQPGSRQTRDFLQAAAQSDQFEILEADTVLAQSSDPNIRAFAQQLTAAHQKTSDALHQAVAKAGLEQPEPGLNGDESSFLASLQSKRGTEFDRTYMRQQLLAHRSALAIAQGYATTGDDATIRQIAMDAVTVITSHLGMIAQLQSGTDGS